MQHRTHIAPGTTRHCGPCERGQEVILAVMGMLSRLPASWLARARPNSLRGYHVFDSISHEAEATVHSAVMGG